MYKSQMTLLEKGQTIFVKDMDNNQDTQSQLNSIKEQIAVIEEYIAANKDSINNL